MKSEAIPHHKTANLKKAVENTLNLLPEVSWDRWAADLDAVISVFGWIPREGQKRADFVLLLMNRGEVFGFSTSSAKYSAEFASRLGFQGHRDCKRVEDCFSGVHAVRLGSEPSEAAK